MSQIKELLDELEIVKAKKDKKDLETWASNLQSQLQQLEENQHNYYFLLLAEVYSVDLRNIGKAHQCLKKIQSRSQLVVYQHQLRLCYLRFLEGDYEEAINGLNLIKVTKDNSAQSSKVAKDFFKRLMPSVDEDDQLVNGKDEQDREGYQFQYFKALRQQRNKQIEQAKRTHTKIYTKYGDASPSIKYEAAKHIILLNQKSNNKLKNQKQYKTIIAQFEQTLPNKQYYYKKIEFLQLVSQILQEDQQDEPINYQLLSQFVLQMLNNNINSSKNPTVKMQLKQVRNALLQQPALAKQICYKFFGDKVYKKLLKEQQKPSKHVTIKQQSIKAQSNKKLKETISQQGRQSLDSNFNGSIMTKINMNSGGYEDRYFYIRKDFRTTKKLFYCKRKGRQSQDDDFYRLKGFKKIELGKKSQALQRSECEDFEEEQCFTLKIDGQEVYQRNFYVQNKQDFKNWIALFKSMAQKSNNNNLSVSNINIKKTILI